jgi:hypothetical protein
MPDFEVRSPGSSFANSAYRASARRSNGSRRAGFACVWSAAAVKADASCSRACRSWGWSANAAVAVSVTTADARRSSSFASRNAPDRGPNVRLYGARAGQVGSILENIGKVSHKVLNLDRASKLNDLWQIPGPCGKACATSRSDRVPPRLRVCWHWQSTRQVAEASSIAFRPWQLLPQAPLFAMSSNR